MKTKKAASGFGCCIILPVCGSGLQSAPGGFLGCTNHIPYPPRSKQRRTVHQRPGLQRTWVKKTCRVLLPDVQGLRASPHGLIHGVHFLFDAFILSRYFTFHLLTREGLLGRKHHARVTGEQWVLRCWGAEEAWVWWLYCGSRASSMQDLILHDAQQGQWRPHHFLPQQKVLIKDTFLLLGQLAADWLEQDLCRL